jgi:hypothetical protein
MSSFVQPTDRDGLACLKMVRDVIAQRGVPIQYQAGGINADLIPLAGCWHQDTVVQSQVPGALATVFLCLADMPADPAKGDLITYNGLVYAVMDAAVDGRGGVRLWLRIP